MRKKKKEIQDFSALEAILKECKVCRLGLCKDNMPYVVPINYGYANRKIYFHTGHQGLKIEYLLQNPKVCVEVDRNFAIIAHEISCRYSGAYESVIAFGKATKIEDFDEKKQALDLIMNQMTGEGKKWVFNDDTVKITAIYEVSLDEITGRRSPAP